LNYGQGSVSGLISKERVCLGGEQKHCLDGIDLVLADKGVNLEEDKFSGILGLAP